MTDTTTPTSEPASESGGGLPRWLKWAALGLIALVVVGYGAIFLYAKVLNDSPDELGLGDLDAAISTGTTVPTATSAPGTADGTSGTAPSAPGTVAATTAAPTSVTDGAVWNISADSELGYRVKEVLFGVDTEAVGRTNQVTGTLTIDGTQLTDASFEVDVASIQSDDDRRDNRFRNGIMTVSEFPVATFALTEPIELGTEPTDGAEVDTLATGELTLRGVTNPVTFPITAKQTGDRIGVLGSIPVRFADYQIANPSFGGVTTEDNGVVEFVLVFDPA